MKSLKRILPVLLLLAAAVASAQSINEPFTLITQEEASGNNPKVGDKRILWPGPRVELREPPQGEKTTPIFRLNLVFRSRSGDKVDTDSLRLTYIRDPMISLTERVRPFIEKNGIAISQVKVPIGEHRIRINLRDTKDRASEYSLTIRSDASGSVVTLN